MDQKIVNKILHTASELYNFNPDLMSKLSGGYENVIYGSNKKNNKIVIRITPPGHRTYNEIQSEINWLHFLTDSGIPVVKIIQSTKQNLVEKIVIENTEYIVVCSKWADGKMATGDDFSEIFFQNWGKVVGQMHSATKKYNLPAKLQKRKEWHESIYYSRDLIPEKQTIVLENFDKLIDELKNLPKDKNSWGLIHSDVHNQNLFLDGEKITVLDFDDCEYGYFIMDIATALGFALWEKPKEMSNDDFASWFLDNFMKGYNTMNKLDKFWIDKIPLIMKLFGFLHYNAFMMDFDLAGEGVFETLKEDVKETISKLRNIVENSLPFIKHSFFPYDCYM